MPRLSVVSYLLRAGYKIEAHLARHYTPRNGELIFGLQLVNHARARRNAYVARPEIAARAVAARNFSKTKVVSAFKKLFSDTWTRVNAATASQMIDGYFRRSRRMTYEDKPIALLAMASRKRIIGLLLLVPKRGGAVKALLMSETGHRDSIRHLLELAEEMAQAAGKRKLYFLHPIADNEIISLFVGRGYSAEGVLRSPYRQGQDAAVYSRFF